MSLEALQAAFELGEQGDWETYALRRTRPRRAVDLRPRVARLAARVPGLELRAQALAVDVATHELAAEADAQEGLGEDPHDALVALFAQKERLSRQAGFAGYAQLKLAADGLTEEAVDAELALAEAMARDDPPPCRNSTDADEVLESFRQRFEPFLDDVEVLFEPRALVAGMQKTLRWPDRVCVVVRDRDDLHSLAHELGHALQCRARATRGLGFLDWFSLGCVESETAAFVAERLLFGRPAFEPRLVELARFELRAYAPALDSTLPKGAWSRSGHGFYTEDPLRRHAYPLAYVRSARLLAALPQDPPAAAVAALL